MLETFEYGHGFLVNLDSNEDLEEFMTFAKKHPGKQMYLTIGDRKTPESMALLQNDSGKSELSDFTGLNELLVTYTGMRAMVKCTRHDIPPTPSLNPKAGRYGQTRHKGKSR